VFEDGEEVALDLLREEGGRERLLQHAEGKRAKDKPARENGEERKQRSTEIIQTQTQNRIPLLTPKTTPIPKKKKKKKKKKPKQTKPNKTKPNQTKTKIKPNQTNKTKQNRRNQTKQTNKQTKQTNKQTTQM
jgi:hypothetical protein